MISELMTTSMVVPILTYMILETLFNLTNHIRSINTNYRYSMAYHDMYDIRTIERIIIKVDYIDIIIFLATSLFLNEYMWVLTYVIIMLAKIASFTNHIIDGYYYQKYSILPYFIVLLIILHTPFYIVQDGWYLRTFGILMLSLKHV